MNKRTNEPAKSLPDLYVNCFINGHAVKAVLATHFASSVMSKQTAERLAIDRLIDTRLQGELMDILVNNVIPLYGKIHLCTIYMKNVSVQADLYIMDSKEEELSIGLNILQRYHCKISLQERSLHFPQMGTEMLHTAKKQKKKRKKKKNHDAIITESAANQENHDQQLRRKDAETKKRAPEELFCNGLHIACTVNGKQVMASVSASYNVSYMSKECAEDCNIKHLIETSKADKQTMGHIPACHLRIENNHSVQAKFTVPEYLLPNLRLIIGLDLLHQLQCTLDLQENQMIFGCTVNKTNLLNYDVNSSTVQQFHTRKLAASKDVGELLCPKVGERLLQVNCLVNGHPVKAVLDTGSKDSCMSKSCVERLDLVNMVDIRYASIPRQLNTLETIGRIHYCPIRVGSNDVIHWKFKVMEDPFVDVLIGMDLLEEYFSQVNLLDKKLISYAGVETEIVRDETKAKAGSEMTRGILQPLEISADPRKHRKRMDALLKKSLLTTPPLLTVSRLYLHDAISINGVPVSALLDTACTTSSMALQCAQRCGVLSLLDTTDTILAAGFSFMRSLGSIHICPLQLGEDTMYSHFKISQQQECDILLGLNFLSQFNVILDLENHKMIIGNTGSEFLIL